MSIKLEQSHDRVVQVLGDELARTSEQLSRDLSSQVTTLRRDHSAQFQTVHEDIVGMKAVQAGILSEQEDLREELHDKVDNMPGSRSVYIQRCHVNCHGVMLL